MNKELQDLVWSVLPKEFKEEVKRYYRTLHEQYKDYDGLHFEIARSKVQERIVTVEYLFGKHNLASDAEGEEMLTVPRNKVLYMYDFNEDILICDPTHKGAKLLKAKLQELFGSKCLPDEDPKPAEPKFKVGDIVRFKYCCTPHRIDGFKMLDGAILYQVGEVWAEESDLEPYTEPTCTNDCQSQCKSTSASTLDPKNVEYLHIASEESHLRNLLQETANCDKQFDNILKDSFSKERRLNIAVQLTCAMIPKYQDNGDGHGLSVLNEKDMIKCAYRLAAMLIAEAEEGDTK